VQVGIWNTKLEIMIRRLLEKLKLIKPRQPHLPQTNVRRSLLDEAIYLLRISQPENCSKWVEGIGDCGKESCNFCRIEKCITELESNDA
jgi:hypothetical protein